MIPSMAGQRFLPQYRLRSPLDFQRVYELRRSASDDFLLIYVCPNQLGHPRVGLSVSRKVGPAVVRNRWKRLLREAFRLRRLELPQGVDLVVIPRQRETPSLAQLFESMVKVSRRAARKL